MDKQFKSLEKLSKKTFKKGIDLVADLKTAPLNKKEKVALNDLSHSLENLETLLTTWLAENAEDVLTKAS